ncbi:hypothetical protein M422DRAFT_272503 [Sphaerobolus stellatus SS14]|uniref:Uncharacterized protein n=1 Tax=Sphaerobolus stellatus (strain SS14) TaxID=990650 RepID=A0A0C9UBF8_SPHS4|nr:hypothetical protein M422DRAFT_272503 [Sphaerobolus stellatus SS14]
MTYPALYYLLSPKPQADLQSNLIVHTIPSHHLARIPTHPKLASHPTQPPHASQPGSHRIPTNSAARVSCIPSHPYIDIHFECIPIHPSSFVIPFPSIVIVIPLSYPYSTAYPRYRIPIPSLHLVAQPIPPIVSCRVILCRIQDPIGLDRV